MSERRMIIDRAMRADAEFVGRIIGTFSRPDIAEIAPVMSFCLGSYFSLFMYEGYARLQEGDSQPDAPLSELAKSMTARSRHSLKFFEDTHRGIEGQIAYFEDEIFPAHAKRFLGNTWLPFARRWETDLGFYRYGGRLISTTHAATFGLGLDPKTMFNKDTGPEVVRIMTEYGQCFGALGATLDSKATSFLDDVDVSQFGKRRDDARSERFYRMSFNGETSPSINALMSVFQSSLNFVDVLVPASLEYSLFKIRLLTVYQVLRSLEVLRAERASELTVDSMAVLAGIIDTAEAQMIIHPTAKQFRNTLMHYGPDNRIDLSLVDKDDIIGTLVPLCYGGQAATDFAAKLDTCISHTAASLNTWALG